MTEAAASISAQDHPTRCVRCGYDLRGHDANGRCPECGLRAHWSLLAPKKLSQYPAGWVRRMSWATRILMFSYLGGAALIVMGCYDLFDHHSLVLPVTLLLLAIAHAVGLWLLAQPSGHWSEPEAKYNRRVLRIAAIGPVVTAGSIVSMLAMGNVREIIDLLGAGAAVVGLFGPPAVFMRLRTVAHLIADESLSEHSGIVGSGFVVVLLILPAIAIIGGFLGRGLPSFIVLGFVLVMLVGSTLFLLWAAFILFCCAFDFGVAAKIVTAQWNADASAV
jgi:hypothetical protein